MPKARMGRRGALFGLVCAATAGGVAPAAFPDGGTLLVAGPAGGPTDRWADLLSPPLGRALMPAAALTRLNVGGADGVTGANQFEARAAPDGTTALLVPGQAALSWLAGESRVRFDAARWVAVWAGTTQAALASRVRLVPGRPIRVAVASLAGRQLAALLTLELMGIEAVPVPVERDAEASLARSDIDAALLCGPALRADSGMLAGAGMHLALTLGVPTAAGQTARDPAFPDLPSAPEAIAQVRSDASPELLNALRAVTAAVQLDVALVLPPLSPAAMVSLWRRGSTVLSQAPDVQSEAARTGIRPANGQAAAASVAALSADVATLLELRRWLAARYNWRPA